MAAPIGNFQSLVDTIVQKETSKEDLSFIASSSDESEIFDYLTKISASDAADTVRDVHVPGVSYSSNPVLVQASSAVHMEFTSEKGRYLTATCDIEPDFRREQCNRLYQASTAGLDDSGRYTRSYQTVYDLLTHLTDMTPSDVVQYALTAQLLLKVLQHSGWFINQKTEPCKNFTSEIESTSETSTGHIDLSTKRVIDSCTRTDTTNRTEDTCDASTLNSGSSDENKLAEKNDTSIAGVITDKPEDERDVEFFHKDTLVVRSVKHVPKGGEIFNCYGPHVKRMSYSERQRCLKEQYFFTCNCLPCLQEGKTEEVLETILHAHNRQLSETQDCLARCYATLGDFKMAADHLEASIKSVEAVYGSDSIELGNELQKLSEILIITEV
ncbi:SMYD4-like protein [Mya arenaria]|uniref:SMYD4-like protein n=1 Tax=Mya arenaria TaxID=6604 RepID=A0ABY7DYI1_MYAAR|nr:SMYD4-like protein [Mya arenaria]